MKRFLAHRHRHPSLIFALLLALCVPLQAQDPEPGARSGRPEPGVRYAGPPLTEADIERVLEVQRQINPNSMDWIQELRVSDPEGFRRFINRQRFGRLGLILALQRFNPDAAKLHIEEERLEYEIGSTRRDLRVTVGESFREELKKEIRQLVADHFDVELQNNESSYAYFQRTLERLRGEIGQRNEMRETLISERRKWLMETVDPNADAFAPIRRGPRPGGPGGPRGPGGGEGGRGSGLGRALGPGGLGGPGGPGGPGRGPRGDGIRGDGRRGPGGPGGPGSGSEQRGPGRGERPEGVSRDDDDGRRGPGRGRGRGRGSEQRIAEAMEVLELIHPRMADAMNELKESDPDDFNRKIRDMISFQLGRLLDEKRYDPVGFELHTTEQRLSNETYDLVRKIKAGQAGDPELAGYVSELSDKLSVHFDARQAVRLHAIKQLEKRIEEMGADLAHRKTERAKVIRQRYNEIVAER
ncbi:MAG: hypothetical protein ACYTGQ_07005 [Planctomycetota bacterium]|jgi:hypothetical protein